MSEKNVWNKSKLWTKELEFLKSILHKTDLIETTKWGTTVFTYKNKNIVGIGGFKSYFGLWFFNGVFLKDKYKLLVNAQEGKTKALRQMRFQSIEAVDEKIILEYITEAISIEEKGLVVIKETNKKEEITSEFLKNELQKDTILREAFEKFTPYKQNEFIEYIATAKQEKTKISRFEKIKPMILENMGLNDKYR